MVKILYLIRHGETKGDGTLRYKGSIDVPLSEKGVEQIKKVSKYLAQDKLSAVYCSDLIRARKSAEIIAKPHGLTPETVYDLRERNFGIWEGMSFEEIKEIYPQEFDAWAENPLKFSPPGGESTLEIKKRSMHAFNAIIKKHDGQSIAIVAHGGINRIILAKLLGIPLKNIFRIEQDFACINIIEFWDKYPIVKLINGKWNMEDGK